MRPILSPFSALISVRVPPSGAKAARISGAPIKTTRRARNVTRIPNVNDARVICRNFLDFQGEPPTTPVSSLE
jgi:hypothetical protein